MLVSSMNLTGHSTSNSREIAIQVDSVAANELLRYIQSLAADSGRLSQPAARAKPKAPVRAAPTKSKRAQQADLPDMLIKAAASLFKVSDSRGKCIRCARAVDLDIDRPLCRDCYQVWSQFSNPDYEETYCLVCGKEKRGITYAKPMCRPCYARAG